MGDIIGGIGSLFGGNTAANDEKKGAEQALTGYNYLNNNPLINQAQSAGSSALTGLQGTTGSINQLLTSNSANNPAYQNYLNSTGYNFQLQQGQDAITGSAAAKGLLNSGATAKALTSYGQNLGAQSFNNYLGQMGSLAGLQTQQANMGIGAAQAVGQAGTAGGAAAGNLTAQAGQSLGSSEANAGNMFGTNSSLNAFASIPSFFGL